MRYRSFGQRLGGLTVRTEREGGRQVQMIDCHIMVEVNSALRPKRRKRIVGEALMKASTMGLERPKLARCVSRYTFRTHCRSKRDEQVHFLV